MNPSDIASVLEWWSVLFLLGLAVLPVTFRLFRLFFDKGYPFSKIIGAMIVTYIVFVVGTVRIAPFTLPTIVVAAVIVAIASYASFPGKSKLLDILKRHWLLFVLEEVLFLSILFIWAYVHSFAPDIHGLEKYMDFGYVNSLLRSTYFPPRDMWFTPYSINYYYFGHLTTAMLTKLSGIPSYITFNLMLSTVMSSCFVLTFSLGSNLYFNLVKDERISKLKLLLSGILSACLVTLGGNLHILYAFFSPYNTDNPAPLWKLAFKPMSFPNSYWYPDATRFIYHTIHEFPVYSWTVADLHGHVLDIPFVLLIIGFLFSLLLIQTDPEKEAKDIKKNLFLIQPFHLIFIGLLLSAMYMTNAWDGAIYWLLTAFTMLYIHGQKISFYKNPSGAEDAPLVIPDNKKQRKSFSLKGWKIAWARDFAITMLVITAGLLLFATPYNLFFNSAAYSHGIGVVCAPDFLIKIGKIGPFIFEADHCIRSYWWELLMLYGFFYFFAIIFAIFLIRAKRHTVTDVFVSLMIILSTMLILIPEFFYLKDIYPTYYRANTMFKLVFQAFIMLALCSGYVIVRMGTLLAAARLKQKLLLFCFFGFSAVLVGLVMLYPFLAINAYYGDFKNYQSLNGINYLKTLYPDDYVAINWINQNIKGQPVILEAQGDSYTDYARISANTGLPTVLGWTVHEWLWRGSYDVPAPRIADVETMYNTSDLQIAKQLFKTYHVQYIYVGTLEYQKYPKLNEQKFNELGHIVFEQRNTRIYKLNS
ncbi:MAG TPA: DUF2298 domain-containing protein [Candidatus Saccharimonadales bacterium]|nr:DUF2298 domain-containing protein [Candidatus Saccharimonadales bacterium]